MKHLLTAKVFDRTCYPCFHLTAVPHIDLLRVCGDAVFRQRFRKMLHGFEILVC
jgi:hypothetical protein